MKGLDLINDIGEFIVIDDINEFKVLIDDFKNEGDAIEKKYVTSLTLENTNLLNFEGFDNIFEKCIFNKVIFQKSYFKNCLFKNCDFSNCDFSISTFQDCIFENVKGIGTNFSESSFKNLQIKESLFRYAVFTSSLLNVCNIQESDMSEAYMDNCKIKKLTLNNVNLIRANFYKTELRGIDFRKSQIDGIVLSAEAKELKGAIVEVFQAAELARLLGVIIK